MTEDRISKADAKKDDDPVIKYSAREETSQGVSLDGEGQSPSVKLAMDSVESGTTEASNV